MDTILYKNNYYTCYFIIFDLKDQLLSIMCKSLHLLILIIFTVIRSNEDIPMQVCEPYVLHQSKPTEYEQTTTVYEQLENLDIQQQY